MWAAGSDGVCARNVCERSRNGDLSARTDETGFTPWALSARSGWVID